jgi:uncharacterized membrane protein
LALFAQKKSGHQAGSPSIRRQNWTEAMDKLSPPTGYKMTLRDVVEVVVGGCVLAFPVAATEEVWKISETLPLGRVAYLIYSSLLFIGLFTYHRYFKGQLRGNVGYFLVRVFGVYFITAINSATILWALDQLMTVDSLSIAINRVVIVSFPASFAATVVESLSRE